MTLPRNMLEFIPFFSELLSEKPNVSNTHYFVPFPYERFTPLIDFMFNPDLGLDDEHYSTWRFFFRVNNIAESCMQTIPEILRIPVQDIIIVPKRGNWYNSKKYGLDHLFATSNYFKVLFSNPVVNNFRIDLDNDDDAALVLILNKEWKTLAFEHRVSEVKEVMAKFAVTLDACLECNSTDYCKCRRIHSNCSCGFPISEKCGRHPEGKKCSHCEIIHYSHDIHPNCREHQCVVEKCEDAKQWDECGYCHSHCSNRTPCKIHHCRYKYAPGDRCGMRLPCSEH